MRMRYEIYMGGCCDSKYTPFFEVLKPAGGDLRQADVKQAESENAE
jgi:hypothetical protein